MAISFDSIESRSFPPERLQAMREAYREACSELGLGDEQTDQHRAIATAISRMMGDQEVDQEALVKAAISAGQKAAPPVATASPA